MWWRRQSRTRLVRAVGPWSSQEIRWWASQKIGGAPHTTQPLSRALRARRMARLTKRCAMPTSRGSEFAPSTIGMICASQASRRIAPADSPSPWVRVPRAWGSASVRSLRSMVMVMCALGPCPASAEAPLVAVSVGVAALMALEATVRMSVRASARRLSGPRGVQLAGDGLAGLGTGQDQGLKEFGVVVRQVAAEPDTPVGGAQPQLFPGVGLVFFGRRAVGVEQVADPARRPAQLRRTE